jgi:hypothetical protein
MKVRDDAAYRAFLRALGSTEATRIKEVRTRPLQVGGRTELVLFVGEGDRAHPRLVARMPAAKDPAPPVFRFDPDPTPTDPASLRAALPAHREANARVLAAADLPRGQAPAGGEHFWRNSIRGQRHAAYFAAVRKTFARWVARDRFTARIAGLRVIREFEDACWIGVTAFDDVDSGTYHSYGKDAPFVHYLEQILAGLPTDGTRAMACLSAAAQESIRRQREQAQAHLDAIMRSKYAFASIIDERDIETTVGGLLIDRETRQIVSVDPDSEVVDPQYELLRIDPAATHPDAGAWIHRDGDGDLRLADGRVVRVDDALVRSAALDPEDLTFARAPGDERLRAGVPLDWNDDGVVAGGTLDWVAWAGHCDVKAVMECIGLVLDDGPRVSEFRSDTGRTQVFDRTLLLEMAASVIELGSEYESIDGTDEGDAGESAFGGARNDARPDVLVFAPAKGSRSIRWPDEGGPRALRVRKLTFADGEKADLDTVFSRWLPDMRAVDFVANPRHVRTIDDDRVQIDVTGAVLEADAEFAELDGRGNLTVRTRRIALDLRPGARGPVDGWFPLGSIVVDAAERRITRVFYDPKGPALVRRDEWAEQDGRRWTVRVSADVRRIALSRRRTAGLAREARRDDPAMYQALLDAALRAGRPICADTDAEAPVWNGMVTKLQVALEKDNQAARVQLWRIDLTARFGQAVLRYMVRRDAEGEPVAYCPVPGKRGEQWPDFLWSELPDVASKAKIDGRWMVNRTMAERGAVTIDPDRSVEGGFYVHDDHIKNVYEILFCALSEYRWTVVHDGKRYGFADRRSWAAACARCKAAARKLTFVG